MSLRAVTSTIGLLLGSAAVLTAQAPRVEAAVGIAQPIGDLAPNRGPGLTARVGLQVRDASGRFRLRFDGEAVQMRARTRLAGPPGGRGEYRALGGVASLMIGPAPRPVAPYLLLGVGAHVPFLEGPRGAVAANPYGTILGTRAGVGIRFERARFEVALEVARHTLWSDHGATEEFGRGGYVPVTIGVRF